MCGTSLIEVDKAADEDALLFASTMFLRHRRHTRWIAANKILPAINRHLAASAPLSHVFYVLADILDVYECRLGHGRAHILLYTLSANDERDSRLQIEIGGSKEGCNTRREPAWATQSRW